MSKVIRIRVIIMDMEFHFSLSQNVVGEQLFNRVITCSNIGLREVWFFGLQYIDGKGFTAWLKPDRRISDHDVKKEDPLQFKFRAKYYPEDVTEIIQDVTLRLFYLQVKDAILSEEVYCPAAESVLLASYAVQARHGDYNPEVHNPGFLINDRLLPQRNYDQYKWTQQQWEEQIVNWWSKHKGMSREDAMLEYLKTSQDLEMFGVNYFEVKNKNGTDLWLGVDALGLSIYDKEDKLIPKLEFPWSEMESISFDHGKIVLSPVNEEAPDVVYVATRSRISRYISALCIGNHDLYLRRREPDTLEVDHIKAQVREERAIKQQEREKLRQAIEAKELVQRRLSELQRKFKDVGNELKHSRHYAHAG